mmetsp:Transcript_10025/g.25467  ORF Transcript_10025/g.25467 Transcript_10025/m.25467 type:complete len:218 (-) Transcript_10025:200-853(-)
MRLVVAPPIKIGCFNPAFCISLATVTISSRLGVMRPDRPRMSALCSITASMIVLHSHITPRSITLKLLHPSTTDTMFLPMSCTSPLTVAITITPAFSASISAGSLPAARAASSFSFSMNGMRWPTPLFITRADLITCGRNILPAPNRSPITFMPSMRGPSMMRSGFSYLPHVRASSISFTMCSSMPLMRACSMRFSSSRSRQLFAALFAAAGPAASP